MLLIYIEMDGTARLEKTKIDQRWVEEPDGYHPKTSDSIWQDHKRHKQAMMLIPEGVTPPIGAKMAHNDMVTIFTEGEVREPLMTRPKVSKMWARTLAAILDWWMRYGWTIIIMMVFVYALYDAFSQPEVP